MTLQSIHPDRRGPAAPFGARFLKDLAVTLILWTYFTLGFAVFFAPRYLWARATARDRQKAFQRLNQMFYRGFFGLVRRLIPRQEWRIAEAVRNIRSSVIVCNHVSYLDPILLISLYERHTTIAKARLFDIPVFGTMLALSGYLPSEAGGRYADRMLSGIETLGAHLSEGGNLIVFPEGTRSRSGRMGSLRKGGFKIARRFDAPINVVRIRNTNRLFQPGRFLFNTGISNSIQVDLVACIDPRKEGASRTTEGLMSLVRRILEDGADAEASAA